MNCKPGDLAVVVSTLGCKEDERFIGRIVRCLAQGWDGAGNLAWLVEPKIPGRYGVVDTCLRPIRPHGDDEQDECKAWLPPVPTKELA